VSAFRRIADIRRLGLLSTHSCPSRSGVAQQLCRRDCGSLISAISPHFGAGFDVSRGRSCVNAVQTADLQMMIHPETWSS
jgi:hypothetical protein